MTEPSQFEIRGELEGGTGRLGVVGESDIATAPLLAFVEDNR